MRIEYIREADTASLLLSGEELRAIFDSLDTRLRREVPMNVAEHKAWEVMRRVLIGGESEAEMDAFKVKVVHASEQNDSGTDAGEE